MDKFKHYITYNNAKDLLSEKLDKPMDFERYTKSMQLNSNEKLEYYNSSSIKAFEYDEDYNKTIKRLDKSGVMSVLEDAPRPGWLNTVLVSEILMAKSNKIKTITIIAIYIAVVLCVCITAWIIIGNSSDIVYDAYNDKLITNSSYAGISDKKSVYTYFDAGANIDLKDLNLINKAIENNIGGPAVSVYILKGNKDKTTDEVIDKQFRKVANSKKDSMVYLVYLMENETYTLVAHRDYDEKYNIFDIPNSDSSSTYSSSYEINMLTQFLYEYIINPGDSIGEIYGTVVKYVNDRVEMKYVKENLDYESISSGRFLMIMYTLIFGGMITIPIMICIYDSINYRELTIGIYNKSARLVNDFERCVKHSLKVDEYKDNVDYTEDTDKEVSTKEIFEIQKNMLSMFEMCNTNKENVNLALNKILELERALQTNNNDIYLRQNVKTFLRKYSALINSTAIKLCSSKDKQKSDKLTKMVYIILKDILDKHTDTVDESTDIDLDTMEHLMTLDGYGDTHGIKMCTHE